jgi:hypothetical protein
MLKSFLSPNNNFFTVNRHENEPKPPNRQTIKYNTNVKETHHLKQ